MKKGERKLKIEGNSFGASGFTISIISILSLGVIGALFAVIGFIFCFIQQRGKPTKLGKAGLILNIIGLILSLLWLFYFGPIIEGLLAGSA